MQRSRGRKELSSQEDLGGDGKPWEGVGEGHFRLPEGYQGGDGTMIHHEMMTLTIMTLSHVPSVYSVPYAVPFTSS